MYNSMGIILEAQVSCIFFLAFMHSFQKLVSDFDSVCVIRDSRRECTTCKLV